MDNFKGAFTALITPFDQKNALDEEGLRLLIRRQIDAAIDGVVFLGTTGESPTLSPNEKMRILKIAHEECTGKTIMIAGTGSFSTQDAIEKTLEAEKAGADAALIITPYYNKPTQEGIFLHFKAIAAASSLPILLYNHPFRTGQTIQAETIKRLMEIPTIVGIKECSAQTAQIASIIKLARTYRPDFTVLSGDDDFILPLMALGGHGAVSTVGNLIPHDIVALVRTLKKNDYPTARDLYYTMEPLLKAVFIETNPMPIKAALQQCGLPSGSCRLPLCNLKEESRALLEREIAAYHP